VRQERIQAIACKLQHAGYSIQAIAFNLTPYPITYSTYSIQAIAFNLYSKRTHSIVREHIL